MAFLFFILFFFLSKPVFAAPDVQITDYSSNSDDEWIQITNKSLESIDLTGWYLLDRSNNKNELSGCINPDKNQIFHNFSKNWLNNTKSGTDPVIDIVYLYQKDNPTPIYTLSYTEATNKSIPESTNTCILPTKVPTPTTVSTPTPTPTATPTPDPTVVNPTSGITLTEFMPYSDPEWIELYNSNDYPVKLVSWKLEEKDANTRNISTLSIPAKSYLVFEYSPFFDNNNAETVILRNQDNTAIAQYSYAAGLRTLDRSWSLIKNNWCQSSITKSYENVTSCYSAPTSTPTPNLTPTPDQSKYTSSDTATESAIIEPTSESSFLSPSPQPTAPSNAGSVLGDSVTNTTQKNYLPLILIISGGLLLTSPLIISKLKK